MANRGVQWPPKLAARGLALWAVDLWPYVNGRALVNGIRLGEMELSDMLDVVHYFYEDDLNYASVEAAQMAEARRISVFKEMYGVDYAYASKESRNKAAGSSANFDFDLDDPVPFDPANAPVKSFIPATEMDDNSFNPFGDILDAPIN